MRKTAGTRHVSITPEKPKIQRKNGKELEFYRTLRRSKGKITKIRENTKLHGSVTMHHLETSKEKTNKGQITG